MDKSTYSDFDASLTKCKTQVSKLKGFMGFDGFVDEIIDVVSKRQDAKNYTPFATISEFAEKIQSSAGKSSNVELVSKQAKIGGNGPIMGLSLASLGLDLTYAGSLGKDNLNPVFQSLADKCSHVYSLCDAGHTDALEFADGKLMLGKHEPLKEITWENLVLSVGQEKLDDYLKNADFFAFVNWTMLPYMTDIWRNFSKAFEKFNKDKSCPVFIDLADFEKRTDEDCHEAIEVMQDLNQHVSVILGLNLSEGQQIGRLLNYQGSGEDIDSVKELAAFIREKLNLKTVCVHPRNFAVSADVNGTYHAVGPYTDKPKISTGAGDHFNAGYFCGNLIGLNQTDALTLGVLNSGYYVRTAISASVDTLHEFAQKWSNDEAESVCC